MWVTKQAKQRPEAGWVAAGRSRSTRRPSDWASLGRRRTSVRRRERSRPYGSAGGCLVPLARLVAMLDDDPPCDHGEIAGGNDE
jgi:hypothetical protein